MKRTVLSLTFAAAVVALTAAPGAAQTSGAAGQQPKPAEKSQQAARSDPRQFINKMAMGNMAEIELGKLAQQNASSPDVKEFGQQMVKDHTQANSELKQLAEQHNVQMPTQLDAKHKQLSDRLSKLKGEEFDRQYMAEMVKDHQQTVKDLKAHTKGASSGAVGTAGDPTGAQAVSQWASKTLPTIEKHLDRAQTIQQKLKGAGK